MSMGTGKTIGIVGLGLIGGSFAKAIKANTNFRVLGTDIDEEACTQAINENAIDATIDACTQELFRCDIVIVALFPGAAVEYILKNVAKMKSGAVVMDICGIKKYIADSVAETCKSYGVEFVGGHPMAGKESWGYKNSTKDMFQGASMILTPIFTDAWALDLVQELCNSIGFTRIVFTDPGSHDKMIGYTSQLAHILSSAYIKNPLCMHYKGYTGGSFQDLTRVAKMNPIMWSELFLLNSDNLINSLDVLIKNLQEYRHTIQTEDREQLIKLLADGTEIKEKITPESKNN